MLLARSLLLVCLFCPLLAPSFLAAARSLACGGPLAIITWSWPLVTVTRHSACSCGSDKTRRRRRSPVFIYFFLPSSQLKLSTHAKNKQCAKSRLSFINLPLRPNKENCRFLDWTDLRGVTPATPANQAAIVMLGSLPRSSFQLLALALPPRHLLRPVGIRPPLLSFDDTLSSVNALSLCTEAATRSACLEGFSAFRL